MNPSRILILKPSSLGDIVHTLPAVRALRSKFPDAHITWMVNSEWSPLLEDNPDINDILIFPRADFRGPSGWLRFARWRADLKHHATPDLILDFQGLLRTGLVAGAFRGVPVCGLSDAREGSRFFQTRTVQVSSSAHAVERYLALAASLGAEIGGAPVFNLPAGRAPDAVLPAAPFVALHPISRGHHKSLSPEAVLAFCRTVEHPVVLVGRGTVNFASTPANIVNLLDRTSLPELIWLLHRAAFIVSVDSGPMHLAAAATDRLLGIHTWSDPCRVGPYRPGAHVWKGGEIFPALDPASSSAPTTVPGAHDTEMMARWLRPRITTA
ncbi:MAG: glycosyltransferase family 9 protein [Chthoniobacterales bacterium]|nr:glycosyltransferase family 9 protein [Chthoniobacterales bacterium]